MAASERLDLDAEITERTRMEFATVELADRVRGSLGLLVVVQLASGQRSRVAEPRGMPGLVLDEPRHQVLIPYAWRSATWGSPGWPCLKVKGPEGTGAGQRPEWVCAGQGRPGRACCRRELGETTLNGVIDRVGRDYFDLAVTGDR